MLFYQLLCPILPTCSKGMSGVSPVMETTNSSNWEVRFFTAVSLSSHTGWPSTTPFHWPSHTSSNRWVNRCSKTEKRKTFVNRHVLMLIHFSGFEHFFMYWIRVISRNIFPKILVWSEVVLTKNYVEGFTRQRSIFLTFLFMLSAFIL